MGTLQSNLAAYINSKPITLKEIARRSHGAVKYGTVHAIANQRHKNIGIETLIGIAKGLGVSIFEVIGAAVGVDDKNNLIQDHYATSVLQQFSQLTTTEKNQLMPYLKVLEREISLLPKPIQKKKAS